MAKRKNKKNFKPFEPSNVPPQNSGCSTRGSNNLNTSSDFSLESESSTSRNIDSSIDSSVIEQSEESIVNESIEKTETHTSNEDETILNSRRNENSIQLISNIKDRHDSNGYRDVSAASENALLSTGTKKKNNATNRGQTNSKMNRGYTQNWADKEVGKSNVRRNEEYQRTHQNYRSDSRGDSDNRRDRDSWNVDKYSANSQNVSNLNNVGASRDVAESWDDCGEDDYDKNKSGLNVNANPFVSNQTQQNSNKIDAANVKIQCEQNKYSERWIHNDRQTMFEKGINRGRGRLDSSQSYSNYERKKTDEQAEQRKGKLQGRDLNVSNQETHPSGNEEQQASNTFSEDSFQNSKPTKFQLQSKDGDREKSRWSVGQKEGNVLSQNWRSDDAEDLNLNYLKRHSEGSYYKTKEQKGFNNKSFGDARITRQNRELFEGNSETTDKEYKQFQEDRKRKVEVIFKKINEIQQDLFAMSKEYSLAHCVAEDLRMGSGIAVSFKRDFKDIDVLFNQRQRQGGLAVLEHDGRYVYYLVTKRVSKGKPTYDTMWSSLKKMRDHIKENRVEKLAIPRLGCGLDRLEWDIVKHMIEFLFKDIDAQITVCNFQQTEDSPEKPQNYSCKIVHVTKPVADIEEETSIIYLSTEDGHVSTEMEELNKKFPFLYDFQRSPKQIGSIIKYKVPNKYYVLNGCIVRKNKTAPFDFQGFRKCVQQVSKDCRKEEYFYIAIQAIKDSSDDLINEKIITILKTYVSNSVHVYVCWDGDLVSLMPERS